MRTNGLHSFGTHAAQNAGGNPINAVSEEIAATDTATAFGFAPASLDSETIARRYLDQALASDAMPAFSVESEMAPDNEFKILGTEAIPLTGTTMVKFRQYYRKTPIYGSLITVELDENNAPLAINSSLGEPVGIDPVAKVSPSRVLEKVRRRAGYAASAPLDVTPRLFYYYDGVENRWRLVYIVENVRVLKPAPKRARIASPPQVSDFVIDAHTGGFVDELPRTATANGQPAPASAVDGLNVTRNFLVSTGQTGGLLLLDPTHHVHTHDYAFADLNGAQPLPGAPVTNPPTPWSPAAVSAHANASDVADFLVTTLQRNGLDGRGKAFVSSINCIDGTRPESVTQEWHNAAWLPDIEQMVYGQRLVNGAMRSYAVSDDVVAHEIVHGLTDQTARLEYLGMSGALNESYSDIFGILVSNRNEPDIARWNWQMGEDLIGNGVPLRDLANPTRHNQPAHMDDYRDLPATRAGDWGGVHTNSGIHNKAAFNLITATTAAGDFHFDPRLVAILFYLALTQHLSRTSAFSDSRRGVELVGQTLFRNDPTRPSKLAAISAAFAAVGIT